MAINGNIEKAAKIIYLMRDASAAKVLGAMPNNVSSIIMENYRVLKKPEEKKTK